MKSTKMDFLKRSILILTGAISSIFNGLAGAAFIPLLFYVLSSKGYGSWSNSQFTELPIDLSLEWAFFAIIMTLFIGKSISSAIFSYLSVSIFNQQVISITHNYSKSIFLNAKKNTAELNSLIAQNFERFSNGVNSFPILISNTFMLMGYYYFIILLNPSLFLDIFLYLIFGVIIFCLGLRIAARAQIKHIDNIVKLFKDISTYLHSLTEIRHSILREKSQISDIYTMLKTSGKSKISSDMIQSFNNLFADTLMLIALFLCTYFVVNSEGAINESHERSLILFIASIAPISIIIQNTSILTAGITCYKNLSLIIKNLSEEPLSHALFRNANPNQLLTFKSIEKKYDNFHLSAANFIITRKSVIFLVGGNGSGKSTLMRILSLDDLNYKGEITINSTQMGSNIYDARQKIGCIFTDYKLPLTLNHGVFDRLEFDLWCERFNVSSKIFYSETKIHFSQETSDGQKTRIALAIELAMQRDIYFFDEITADQDPQYRKYFFEVVLPYIKSKGRSVIMITHDDRFFNSCDYLYKLDCGVLSDPIQSGFALHSTKFSYNAINDTL